jgi:hypothetical protein
MMRQLMKMSGALCLVAITLSSDAAATGALIQSCSQPLVTTTLPEKSYAVVNVREFGGLVFLYAPEIRSARPGAFDAFQLWVVEGVYGRPFLQASGAMDQAAFDRLRKNTNVRARSMSISRSGQSQSLTVARQAIQFETSVRTAPSGSDTVDVKVCRGR